MGKRHWPTMISTTLAAAVSQRRNGGPVLACRASRDTLSEVPFSDNFATRIG